MKLFYDFHIHSCLSLCAEDDMTPASIAGMAYLAGLNAFSISDHQGARNCPAGAQAAREHGLLFIPGLELQTREEVHILCLFAEVGDALRFSDYVGERLLVTPRGKPTWRQTVMDAYDRPIAEEPRWLGSAADIGVYEADALLTAYGGLAIPAHIDRPSFSLLANLGFYDPLMGFTVCEIGADCDLPALLDAHPELRGMRFIRNSDAHSLTDIADAAHSIEVEAATPHAVLAALRRPAD